MKMSMGKLLRPLLAVLALVILTACGNSSGTPTTGTPSTTGTLLLSLTDAALYQYQGVYVTIDEVSVHLEDTDDWQVVASTRQTVNLLELVNGVLLELGLTEMDPGGYTQLRLMIGDIADAGRNIFGDLHPYANYLIDENDEVHELTIPSGMQSGIKLVKGFDINVGEITELILDFDAAKSVVKAGKSGKYLLKPTIKVLDTRQYAVIEGSVEDLDSPGLYLPGAMVSAQNWVDAEDEAAQVSSVAATLTDASGAYKLLVDPGEYNLVAFAEGYHPDCSKIEAIAGTTWTGDFLLIQSMAGATLTGGVTVLGGAEDQQVDVSVRQVLFCYDQNLLVEILRGQIATGGTFSFNLPAGDYRVVASTIGRTTQALDITLSGDDEPVDFTFEE